MIRNSVFFVIFYKRQETWDSRTQMYETTLTKWHVNDSDVTLHVSTLSLIGYEGNKYRIFLAPLLLLTMNMIIWTDFIIPQFPLSLSEPHVNLLPENIIREQRKKGICIWLSSSLHFSPNGTKDPIQDTLSPKLPFLCNIIIHEFDKERGVVKPTLR